MSDSIAVIVLAAGGSARLGQPKQLVRYGSRTLIQRAAAAAAGCGCGPVLIVLGAEVEACRGQLAQLDLQLRVLTNAHWRTGIASSIRVGVAAADSSEVGAAILMTCDQPHVDAGVLCRLVDRRRKTGARLVASAYGDTLGVPALFERGLFSELLALRGDRGAKVVIEAQLPNVVVEPFAAGLYDVDTIADVERLDRP